ncbi:hypothetical protein SDC9_06196 [bioreactor metagenome]|uniref:Uncharacterized protein n=1 Tax=bioreactor metagenome TaxID=1076179 RepID=A0A644T156_9ZZZZ|nr:anaerobic ribonucleoside-triphosphate reductase [Negativicutes bacterium]
MDIIDNVRVIAQQGITQEEIESVLAEEKKIWAEKGRVLGEIQLDINGDEIVVKAYERSPIKRVRRITGYLSTEEKFNDAKQAELMARKVHF